MGAGTITLRIGTQLVGLRADTEATLARLRALLAVWIDDTQPEVPWVFDVRLEPSRPLDDTAVGRSPRSVPQLRLGQILMARSRHADDVVRALGAVLGGVLAHQDDTLIWSGMRAFAGSGGIVLVDARPPAFSADPALARSAIGELPTWVVAIDGATVRIPPPLAGLDWRAAGLDPPDRSTTTWRTEALAGIVALDPAPPDHDHDHDQSPGRRSAAPHRSSAVSPRVIHRLHGSRPSNDSFETDGCWHHPTERSSDSGSSSWPVDDDRPLRGARPRLRHRVIRHRGHRDLRRPAARHAPLRSPSVRPARPPTTESTSNHCRTPTAASRWFTVRFDGVTVHATLIEGSLVSHVLMAINQRVAAAVRSSGSIPLHASSVAGTQGALVLAGASQSGKTTLAAALAVTGQQVEFLADEVSAIDPTELTIAAYGKPAALRMPGRALLAPYVERLRRDGTRYETDERFVPPSELGARLITPARLATIVFPRFEANTAGSGIELASVGPADALTRLVHLTLGSEPVDVGTFRSLEHLVRTVEAIEVRYADAIGAAEQLLAVLEGRSAGRE